MIRNCLFQCTCRDYDTSACNTSCHVFSELYKKERSKRVPQSGQIVNAPVYGNLVMKEDYDAQSLHGRTKNYV